MSVGYPLDKASIDLRIAGITQVLRDHLDVATTVKSVIDGLDDAALAALGYTPGDITATRAAITDLYNLARVARGQQEQAGANDFFFNARKFLGVS